MQETSEFTIVFNADLNNLKDLPARFQRIFKEIESIIDATFERVKKGNTVQVPKISIAKSLEGISKSKIIKEAVPSIIGLLIDVFGDKAVEQVRKQLLTNIEKLKEFETQVVTLRRQATAALEDIEKFGERPNAVDENGLPLAKATIQKRIDSLNSLLQDVSEVEDRLTTFQLRAGIPEQPKIITPVLPLPIPVGSINIGAEPLDIMKPLEEKLQQILKGINPLTEKASELSVSLQDLFKNSKEGALIFGYTKEELDGLRDSTDETAKSTKNLGENGIAAVTGNAKQAGKSLGSMDTSLGNVGDNAQTLDNTIASGKSNIQGYGEAAKNAADGGLTDLEGKVKDVSTAASNLDLAGVVKDLAGFDPSTLLPGFLKPLAQADDRVKQVGNTFEDTSKIAQNSLDELGVFASDIASEINNTFADLIYRGLKGNLDGLSDLWHSTLDAMLNTFAKFAATIISNPIRVVLDAVLRGGSGSGGGKGFLGSLGGIFDIGKGFKTIGKGLSKIPGVSSIIGGVKGLFAEGGPLAGIGSFLSSALPVIGAIASVVSFAIPLLSGLFKKNPHISIDVGKMKTDLGDIAATVGQLLDPNLFEDFAKVNYQYFSTKGTYGGKQGILDTIQKAISDHIKSLQGIINKLPDDLAKMLNDALLNTTVDITTKLGSHGLIGINATAGSGKKIMERIQKFLGGELQAGLDVAIRSWFHMVYETLGAAPDKAQAYIQQQLDQYTKAKTPEARTAIGQAMIDQLNAFVDAFNIVSGNVNDAVSETISSLKSLSSTLGFDAVPSIGDLKKSLADLINIMELDPATVQQYADLRNAI